MRTVSWLAAAVAASALAGCTGGTPGSSGLPILSDAPDVTQATGWINSPPLSLKDLEGQVVLIDFWTYSCINCIRTLPHVTGWYDTYEDHGLVVVGVHSPEFAFEEARENVEEAVDRFGVRYPVAQDNAFDVWRAYENRYWPAKYLVDAEGRIRYQHFGEGAYAETEDRIRDLLAEAGYDDLPARFEGSERQGQRGTGITPELYAGTGRQAEAIGNAEGYDPGKTVHYTLPDDRQRDRIYFHGDWHNDPEFLRAESSGIATLRFHAGAANFVADGPDGFCVPVTLDGASVPAGLRGGDVQERNATTCIVLMDTPRSYDVYAGPVATHEVRFDVPSGFALYTFAFSAYDQSEDPT